MTTEEKLQNFYKNTLESANSEAQEIVSDYRAALDKLFEEHKAVKDRQDSQRLADETEKRKRDTNKALSEEQLTMRRKLSAESLRIQNDIFARVEQKLKDFKKTPAYIDYLCAKISEAKKQAPNGSEKDIVFLLDSSDSDIVEEVEKRSGVQVGISKENILGGLRALIPDRNILIDNTFASLLSEERESFSLEGGMKNE